MKLITKELEQRLPPLYSQEEEPDPMVRAKFFHPMSAYTFWAIEYDPEQRLLFGYATNGDPSCAELGYASVEEMEAVTVFGLGIERDRYFTPRRLSEVRREVEQQNPLF